MSNDITTGEQTAVNQVSQIPAVVDNEVIERRLPKGNMKITLSKNGINFEFSNLEGEKYFFMNGHVHLENYYTLPIRLHVYMPDSIAKKEKEVSGYSLSQYTNNESIRYSLSQYTNNESIRKTIKKLKK